MQARSQATAPITEALAAVRDRAGAFRPRVVITLGSGLAAAAAAVEVEVVVDYQQIPGLVSPTIAGHPGQLVLGRWNGQPVAVFQGRLHYYEGHSWERVTLPVRLAAGLGAGVAVFTNMSGAVSRRFVPGAVAIIDDHINLVGSNPLVGLARDANPFIDMQDAYAARLRRLLYVAATELGLEVGHGVYAAVSGPNYETPAEVRALAVLGADLVGMSTVGEVLVARSLGLECCALSCVANLAAGLEPAPIGHSEVLEAGQRGARRLADLLGRFLTMI